MLWSHRENLSPEKRRRLTTRLAANKRLNTRYLLQEQFGQRWEYRRESWARKFFDQWRASLQWQRQRPFEKFAELIERYCDGISAYCRPQNKVALGVVEGLNNKIRVIQRRCYGIRDEDYLQLKILPCTLPPAYFGEADHSVRTKSITGFGPKRSHVSRHVDHRMRWGHGIG